MVLADDIHSYLYRNIEAPSFLWRSGSYSVILFIHTICRAALFGFNKAEVHGLDRFLHLLQARADYKTRTKGLITVSNHISVLDDPLIWGSLPMSFAAFSSYQNHRWSFGSHDLCFTNTPLSHFFTLGQTLPTHRIKHSIHGGLFQPTFTEGVRILSRIDDQQPSYNPHCATVPGYRGYLPASVKPTASNSILTWPRSAIDPFSPLTAQHGESTPAFPSYPHDVRVYNAPSRYATNSFSWVHIFPEGFVHQTDPHERHMRYFKWGVSRLILEPPETPDLVPMFIEGTDQIMHESRPFPRFIPRLFKRVSITFGAEVDVEAIFGDLRKRWREICDRENAKELGLDSVQRLLAGKEGDGLTEEERKRHLDKYKQVSLDHMYRLQLGVINEKLKWDPEVVELRKECTRRVREEVLKLRRQRGYSDEDPKAGLAETWKLEGPKREGEMADGSWVKET